MKPVCTADFTESTSVTSAFFFFSFQVTVVLLCLQLVIPYQTPPAPPTMATFRDLLIMSRNTCLPVSLCRHFIDVQSSSSRLITEKNQLHCEQKYARETHAASYILFRLDFTLGRRGSWWCVRSPHSKEVAGTIRRFM